MANAIALNPAEDPLSESGKDEGHLHVEQLDKIADDAPYKFIVSRTGDGDVALGLFDNPDQVHEAIDPQTEKSLMRRVDWMILPYIAVCYAFFYIDKTTLSYAAIFGIETDLHLKGTQYSWLSAAFYFGFLFFAIPTNLLLQRFPVGKYLGINIFVWGILLMCQAACKDFASLTVLRVLGGAAEACADPAFLIITSSKLLRDVVVISELNLHFLSVVYTTRATRKDRTMVYGKWHRDRAWWPSRFRNRQYQGQAYQLEVRIHHHWSSLLRMGDRDVPCEFKRNRRSNGFSRYLVPSG